MSRYIILLSLCLLSACATEPKRQLGNQFAYSYSTFNFSGDLWSKAKSICQAEDKKAKPQVTDCGFLVCQTVFTCE
jgi:uncharacterized membrane protein